MARRSQWKIDINSKTIGAQIAGGGGEDAVGGQECSTIIIFLLSAIILPERGNSTNF